MLSSAECGGGVVTDISSVQEHSSEGEWSESELTDTSTTHCWFTTASVREALALVVGLSTSFPGLRLVRLVIAC